MAEVRFHVLEQIITDSSSIIVHIELSNSHMPHKSLDME